MIKHTVNILLGLCVALNLDITFPKFIPCFIVEFNQPVTAFQLGKNGQPFSFI